MPRRGQNIYKRKDGRWEGRYIRCHDENGKAKYGYVYARSYSEAKQLLLSAVNALVSEMKVSSKSICYSELLDKWLAATRPSVKESTYVQYRKLIETHIRPYLGEYRICELSTDIVEKHILYLLSDGRKDKKGGLSAKSVSDILTVIRDSMSYAGALGYSVSCDLSRIRVRTRKPDMRVLSVDEQKKLMNVLCSDTDRYKLGVILSLFTGLRIGELCALKWENFDLHNAVLTVNKTLRRIQSGYGNGHKTKVIITSPKSERSVRDIPIPPFFAELAKGFYTSAEDFVLSGSSTVFVEPRVIQYKFKKYIKAAGIADANFHALRHTFATRCIECGFETKSLSEILGHSSVTITLGRYVHSSMELKRQNMNRLNAVCGF